MKSMIYCRRGGRNTDGDGEMKEACSILILWEIEEIQLSYECEMGWTIDIPGERF